MSMDSISQGSSPRMGAMSEDQMSIRSCEELCSRIKLMCSYGGKIMPRPHDNQLRYIGGESRILVVNRNISFADLMAKLSKISGKEIAIKYQLPNEDLDALVSVLGEDDLESMIEEYDRLEARDSSSRLRLFLFPTNMKQQDQPQQNLMDFHEDNRNAEQRFVDAINGLNLGRNVEPARAIHQPVSSQLPDFLFGFEAREIRSPVQVQSPSQAQFTQQPWQQAVGPLITLQSSSPLQAPASPPVSLKQQSPVGSLMTLQSSSPPPLPPQKSASPPVSVKQQTTVGSLMTLQSSSPPPLPPQMPQPTFASPPASLKQQTPVLKPPISPSQNVGIIGQSVEEHPPQPEIPVSPPQAKVPSTQGEDKVGLPDLVLEIGQTEGKQGEALHTTDPKDVDGKNLFLDVRSKVELSNQDLQVTPDPSLQKELEILEKQPVKSPDKAQGISYEIKGEKQQESPGTNKEFQESPKKVLPKSPPLPPQHQERLVVLDALPTLPPSQQQERLITYDQLPQQQQQQQQQLQQERVVAYDQQQQHQQLMQQTERQLFDQDDPTPPSFQQEPFSGILPRKVVLDPSLLPQHQQQAILQQAGPYQQVYANAIYWQAEDDSQHPQLQYESGLRSGNVILQRVVPSQVPAASIQRLSSAPQMRVAQGVANNANLNRQFSAGYADVYQQQMQMQMQQQQIQMQMQMQLQQQQQQQQSPPVVQQQQQQSPPAVQPPLPQGKISYVQQNTKNLHSYQPSPRLSPVKIQDQIGAERVIARPPASGTRVQQQPIAVDPANDPTAYEPSAPQLHFIDKAPLTPQYVNSTPFPDLFKDAGIHHVYQEVPVSVEEGQARRLAVHQVARGS